MGKRLLVDVPCDWLQVIRLVHALSESRCIVVVPYSLENRFRPLRDVLGMNYEVGTEADIKLSRHIRISHADPVTAFGALQRPLVFPQAMVDACASLWRDVRENRFSFAGLITPERKALIGGWAERNLGAGLPRTILWEPSRFLPSRLRALFPTKPCCNEVRVDELLLWSSTRGRVFPGKSWDQEYFEMLGNSQFVLCPRGDCVWSYRFFEAILCGAIPVVQELCPAMEGYAFVHMEEEVTNIKWDVMASRLNFKRLIDRLTFHAGDVDEEVMRLAV